MGGLGRVYGLELEGFRGFKGLGFRGLRFVGCRVIALSIGVYSYRV